MSVDIKKLTKPFPKDAIKRREGARGRTFDYVETHTVIHRLNEATDNVWDFHITSQNWRADLLIVTGELTIPGLGTRTGTGVQRVTDNSGEDLVKGAASDCLKKCATLFGVALELYGPDYEAGETTAAAVAEPKANGGPIANIGATARALAFCSAPGCKVPLTRAQETLSRTRYGQPLCPSHQTQQPRTAAAV